MNAHPAVVEDPLAFTELVCGDPGLLRREFDELIAASWDEPPPSWPLDPRPNPARRPAFLPPQARHRTPPDPRPAWTDAIPTAQARERGPPEQYARSQENIGSRWWLT